MKIGRIEIECEIQAKETNHYKVGDKIKLMKKEYDKFKVFPGVIVDVTPFDLPTLTIAYIDADSYNIPIKFLYYNDNSEDIQIHPATEHDLLLNPGFVLEAINQEIRKREVEIAELERKRNFIANNLEKFFGLRKEKKNDS